MLKSRLGIAALAAGLLLPLAACSQDKAPLEPVSLGAEIVYTSGSSIHFATTGEVVEVERDILFTHYSAAGILAEVEPTNPRRYADLVLVRKDGTVTDVAVPAQASFATDPESRHFAWTDPEKDPGTVVVVDLLTGEEQARVTVPGRRILQGQVSLEGDVVWLHDGDFSGAFRIDWRTGDVEKVELGYPPSQVHGQVAVTRGGSEGLLEAGLGRPGVIDLQTGRLIVRGNRWQLSPAGNAVGREQARYADGGIPVSGHLVIHRVPKGRTTRFPLTYDGRVETDWGWTADGTQVLWFEGSTLHACEIATRDCTTTETDVDPDETFGAIPST